MQILPILQQLSNVKKRLAFLNSIGRFMPIFSVLQNACLTKNIEVASKSYCINTSKFKLGLSGMDNMQFI